MKHQKVVAPAGPVSPAWEGGPEREKEFAEAAINSLPGVFYLVDPHNRLLRWNKNLERLSGYTPEEISRMNALDFIVEEHRALAAQRIRQVFREGQATAELDFLAKDGRRVPHFFTGQQFEVAGLTCFVGTGIDISSRKEADRALRRQNERFQLLSEAASRLLLAEAPSQILQELFGALSAHLGLDAYLIYLVDAAGALCLDSATGISGDLLPTVAKLGAGEAICGAVAQQRRPLVASHIQQSIEPRWKLVRSLGLQAYVSNPLLVGDRLLGTLSFGTRSREEFSREELQFLQTISYYVAMAHDRARHRRDLERLVAERTAKLQQTVESLEQVLYHVAHDLRAPLRSMEGFTSILLQQFAPQLNAEGERLARLVSSAARRMDRLIQDLLVYGSLGHATLRCSKVLLDGPVAAVLGQLERDFQEKNAHVEVQRPLPAVSADPGLLQQILGHLVINALSFVPPERTPHLRIWAQENGHRARLWVADNGIGIAPEHQERIFRVFERLSQEGDRGTGMGLAIVKKGMERMGGQVGVESVPGEGSRFWLDLPLAEGLAA